MSAPWVMIIVLGLKNDHQSDQDVDDDDDDETNIRGNKIQKKCFFGTP